MSATKLQTMATIIEYVLIQNSVRKNVSSVWLVAKQQSKQEESNNLVLYLLDFVLQINKHSN